MTKSASKLTPKEEDIIISRNESVQFTPINSFDVVIQVLLFLKQNIIIKLVTLSKDIALSKVSQHL